jgi:hypothetical protein
MEFVTMMEKLSIVDQAHFRPLISRTTSTSPLRRSIFNKNRSFLLNRARMGPIYPQEGS